LKILEDNTVTNTNRNLINDTCRRYFRGGKVNPSEILDVIAAFNMHVQELSCWLLKNETRDVWVGFTHNVIPYFVKYLNREMTAYDYAMYLNIIDLSHRDNEDSFTANADIEKLNAHHLCMDHMYTDKDTLEELGIDNVLKIILSMAIIMF